MNHQSGLYVARLIAVPAFVLLGLMLTPQGLRWAAGMPGVSDNDHLLRALTNDDVADLRCVLQEGAKVEVRFPAGGTPLIFAAYNSDPELVRELLEHGADVNTRGPCEVTPLQCAVGNGRIRNARMLLAWGADVNCVSRARVTPLLAASRNGDTEMAALLLANGAKVERACPILVEAAGAPNATPELIRLLVSAGGDVNATDDHGVKPVEAALRAGRQDLADVLCAY